MLECNVCHGKIFGSAKFCPQCGDPVTADDRPVSDVSETQAAVVEISFGKSSSPNYSRAIDICSRIPTYRATSESGGRNAVTLPITEVELLINLYDLVGGWKSSRMLINGQPAGKSALVYKGAGCFRECQLSHNPEQYCFGEREYEFNIWGCKRLGMPLTDWGGGWLDYGSFDSAGVWHLQKDRILHDLELAMREYDLCPWLNRKRVLETLAGLPNSIDPRKDARWEYRTEYRDVNGDYRHVAVGIRPVLRQASTYVVGSFRPEWKPTESHGSEGSSTDHVSVPTPESVGGSSGQQSETGARSSCLGTLLVLALALVVVVTVFVALV